MSADLVGSVVRAREFGVRRALLFTAMSAEIPGLSLTFTGERGLVR